MASNHDDGDALSSMDMSRDVNTNFTENDDDDVLVSNPSELLESSRNEVSGSNIGEDDEDGSVFLAAGGDAAVVGSSGLGGGDGGGFVIRGRVNQDRHVRTVDISGDGPDETVDLLSSDDDDTVIENGLEDDDLEVVAIRPLSKSMFAPPRGEGDGQEAETDETRAEVVGESHSEVNIEEREGYIKEYIDGGLGVLFSMECGLVLFHLRNCMDGGQRIGEEFPSRMDDYPPGTRVQFLDSNHEHESYKFISAEGFIRQAAALWIGERPAHLLKDLGAEVHQRALKAERKDFVDHVREGRMMRAEMVRTRGQITGFLSDDVGLIETADVVPGASDGGAAGISMVVFHVDDLYIFGRSAVSRLGFKGCNRIQDMFPPGLRVCFDARTVGRFRGVTAQAVAVFAGSWPRVPHPTALPGGRGSNAPCHEDPHHGPQTFYYLNSALEDQLDAKLAAFRRRADQSIELQRTRHTIDSREDQSEWRATFAPPWIRDQNNRSRRDGIGIGRKRNYHEFKRSPPRLSDKAKKKVIKLEESADPVVKMEPLCVKQEPPQ